jgi:PAS domain S-box-containing protein
MNYLQQIISAFDEPVFVFDRHGNFTDGFNLNENTLMPRSEFVGRHHSQVLPPDVSDKLNKAFEQLESGRTPSGSFEYSLEIRKRKCWFSCFIRPLSAEAAAGHTGYVAVIRDKTSHFEQQASIRLKEDALMASAIANEALLKDRNIVHAAGIGLRELGRAMNVDRCYLFRNAWNEQLGENVSNQLLEWTKEFVEPQLNNPELQDVPFSLVHPFMEALLENRPFICLVSRLPDSGLRKILEMQEIQSLIALPIWLDERLWGFVGFDDCENERVWSNSEVSILSSFATSIVNAIKRGMTEDSLQQAKVEADIANKSKSIFLSNITHEIRTPLHGVIGYTEMLSSFTFPPPAAEYFKNIRISANTLYELINNILDFSKIEAGAFDLNPENYPLADIIDSSIASVSYLLQSSGNQLVTRIDYGCLPELINVDATRLRQILINLLSNALKFSADSIVELSVAMGPQGLGFRVRDRGIGIGEEQLKLLFSPFTQFDSSFSKKYQGTGLGLSITQHILKLMGSEVHVESEIGKGSVFAFTLPAESIAVREITSDFNVVGITDLAGLELDVMIVEDNRVNMMLAETILRDIAPAIRIHKAENGIDAIQLVKSGLAPDLVLMDLQMPLMDGFETTKVIRELYPAPVRIVALTASAISEVRDRCLNSGMDDFLTKPFTRVQLSQLLQRSIPGI